MKHKFIVTIGSPQSEITLVETMPTRERLFHASDVYAAHKEAYFDCVDGQEILTIKDSTQRVLYTLKDGFIK